MFETLQKPAKRTKKESKLEILKLRRQAGAMRAILLISLIGTFGMKAAEQTPAAPYPPSPIIKRVTWTPKTEIIRLAKGSDNWPVTWAADGSLFGAYGDGNGFEPFVPRKLSLGIAQILGDPPNIKGVNIPRTPEFLGDGKRGIKGGGILFLDGVLYLLERNATNSQLAWSTDSGKTWINAEWRFTESFGCPTFLNFGRNYTGARDAYVYIYSPDGPSAYEAADRMTLARVPKTQLRERAAYEFFAGLTEKKQPLWSKNIRERAGVFNFPGNCFRGGITYNAALKRYLWCQILPTSKHPQGPRFQGGFGIYDATEPWGPWTTVYFTTEWDVGPGDTSSFPTKWMSADGKTAWLLFSGEDSFSLRKATFDLTQGGGVGN